MAGRTFLTRRPYRRKVSLFSLLTRTRIGLLLLSTLHAVLVLLLTLVLLNSSFVGGTEVDLFERTIGARRVLFKLDEKPEKDMFLFINVSYARQLVEKLDKDGFPVGNQDITDRKQLARFFRILNQRPSTHKFIVCDVRFSDPSPDDRELLSEMSRIDNLLIPYHQSEPPPIFDLPSGLADYTTADPDENFLKFSLFSSVNGETYETIPLIMYRHLHDATFQKGTLLSRANGNLSLNTFVLDFRIRNYDLFFGDFRTSYLNLTELLFLPDDAVLEMVHDRIILIGDFEERDIHQTMFGETAGSLILLNAYLALVHEDNILPVPFLILLFLGYTIISYNIFSGQTLKKHRWIVTLFETVQLGEFIADLVSYLVLIGASAVALSFLFGLHINILLIATYLTVLETTVEYFERRHSKPSSRFRRLFR